MISKYDIERLQNIVANEQGLLDLNLIHSSQLALSKHNLEHAIELQSTQVSKAAASSAIAHAIRDHYRAQYPGLDLDEGAACAAGPIQRVSPYARFNAAFYGIPLKQFLSARDEWERLPAPHSV